MGKYNKAVSGRFSIGSWFSRGTALVALFHLHLVFLCIASQQLCSIGQIGGAEQVGNEDICLFMHVVLVQVNQVRGWPIKYGIITSAIDPLNRAQALFIAL